MLWNVKKILVLTDGSKDAQYAIAPALDIAKQKNAEIITLFVVKISHGCSDSVAEAIYKENIGAPAIEVVSSAAKGDGVKVRGMIEQGNVVDKIIEIAEREDVDLIVMGTKGASATGRPLGSVAASVVAHAHCPILAVRKKD